MNNPTRSPTTKIQCNEDGSLDEVFGTGDFHLEQMDSNHWWMALETSAGRVVVNLRARGKISAYVEAEPPFPRVPEVDHQTEREAFEACDLELPPVTMAVANHLLPDGAHGKWNHALQTYMMDCAFVGWQARAACFAGGSPAKDVEAPAATNQGWRPIDTAPKDGRKVMLWWGERVVYGYWLDNSKTAHPWAGWRGPSMEPMSLGQPTHWMPLPAAPIGADT